MHTIENTQPNVRPHVKGKFLYCAEHKFYAKGVTYGTFKPDDKGFNFPELHIIERDFLMMAMHGINCIRTYSVPPTYLLDVASNYNLKVMVGLPWEQHITFLDSSTRKQEIINNVQKSVAACNNHSAILCYTIGNEIPAPIVRWYGKRKIESFLKQLYKAVKEVDEFALVSYVNYPTTEYLDLSFLDFDCFNVYLETPDKLAKYISRLHNLSGNRPLMLAEIGLDSYRNGAQKQAEVLSWQIQTVFEKGCAGMFVFAWTDEWWRGGNDIEDWDFGLVDRKRNPKPALFAVSVAMDNIPFSTQIQWPAITVIVCSYNGSYTIKECLENILKLEYPNFDVLVVNDGSKDNLAEIVSHFPVKIISTPNRGLSSARNTGMKNASGEIIAYIDDDAYPDPQWLQYLAYAYLNSDHVCIGGPNISPYEDPFISTCVANAPGGPLHVLETDEIAEHVPGCNMSFRKESLIKIGGFDPQFRCAGDDVDICWRIQESGETIGFHASAVVWHHRRNSFKAYWKQQKGYGKAEALLQNKWPKKYNSLGHVTWGGRIYGNGLTLPVKMKKDRIFYGTWGSALFQSVYQSGGSFANSITLMPEWYLLTAVLGLLGCLGIFWKPLLLLLPLFVITIYIVVLQAFISAKKNSSLRADQLKNYKYNLVITLLHLIQPVARLSGRFMNGLTPWKRHASKFPTSFSLIFHSGLFLYWSEEWKSSQQWLTLIENNLNGLNASIKRGSNFDTWDIQVRNGLFTKINGILVIEEHGSGKQYLKFKCTKQYFWTNIILSLLGFGIAGIVFFKHQYILGGILALMIITFALELFKATANAMSYMCASFQELNKCQKAQPIRVIDSEGIDELITKKYEKYKENEFKLQLNHK